ncbi:MAG: NAD-binding protein [Campylobacterota bacterium]|nr:NAD-binding protein [Campylobacterota bacterium]
MNKISALIFGCNEYANEIVKNIQHKYKNITVFKHASESRNLELERAGVEIFDFSDSWDFLKDIYDLENSILFCVLEDDAENIFLTISLRATFEELNIIALSKNKESANKLSMAGANKVIPMVQTTASIISDMLEKPIVTDVLHNILYENSDLKIAQIEVVDESYFDGKYPADIEWSNKYGIIVLSIIHEDMSSEFIYSSKAKHHAIKNGDIFVIVGYSKDIKEFEKLIGKKDE